AKRHVRHGRTGLELSVSQRAPGRNRGFSGRPMQSGMGNSRRAGPLFCQMEDEARGQAQSPRSDGAVISMKVDIVGTHPIRLGPAAYPMVSRFLLLRGMTKGGFRWKR